jgi:hypothetical protein
MLYIGCLAWDYEITRYNFSKTKSLPTLGTLKQTYGIKFKALSQEFDSQNIEIEVNGFTHIMSGGTYPLEEFIKDYCELKIFAL